MGSLLVFLGLLAIWMSLYIGTRSLSTTTTEADISVFFFGLWASTILFVSLFFRPALSRPVVLQVGGSAANRSPREKVTLLWDKRSSYSMILMHRISTLTNCLFFFLFFTCISFVGVYLFQDVYRALFTFLFSFQYIYH